MGTGGVVSHICVSIATVGKANPCTLHSALCTLHDIMLIGLARRAAMTPPSRLPALPPVPGLGVRHLRSRLAEALILPGLPIATQLMTTAAGRTTDSRPDDLTI